MKTLEFMWILLVTLLLSACASTQLEGREGGSGQGIPEDFRIYTDNKQKVDSILTCVFKNDREKVFFPLIKNDQGVTYLYLFQAQGLESNTVLIDLHNREKINPSFSGPGLKIGFEDGKLLNAVGSCGDLPCLDPFIERVDSCNNQILVN